LLFGAEPGVFFGCGGGRYAVLGQVFAAEEFGFCFAELGSGDDVTVKVRDLKDWGFAVGLGRDEVAVQPGDVAGGVLSEGSSLQTGASPALL
jgi:hypothetical protein